MLILCSICVFLIDDKFQQQSTVPKPSHMHCSQLQQIIPNPLLEGDVSSTQIVTGICDYIPCSLKNNTSLTIDINGDYQTILNSVLWNQFFTKTLIKECQHHLLMQSYISEGDAREHPIFVKTKGKIFKLEECLNWNCEVRRLLSSSKDSTGDIVMEGFTNAGKTRRILITFGQYSQRGPVDLILKTTSCENKQQKPEPVKQSSFPNELKVQTSSQSNIELSANKKRAKSSSSSQNIKKTLGNANLNTKIVKQSAKISTMTNFSLKKKVQEHWSKKKECSQNKQNKEIVYRYKQPEKQSKIIYSSHNTFEPPTSRIFAEQVRNKVSNNFSVPEQETHCRPSNGREIVLSKILSSKEEIIISLKEQLRKQQSQYLELLQEERRTRREEAESLSQNIKNVLTEYQNIQKDQLQENMYLKERVKVLQQALTRRESEAQAYLSEKQSMILAKRAQEDTLKQVNERFKVYRIQSEAEIKQLNTESQRRMQEFQKLTEKYNMYQSKYEGLVAIMKKSIPLDD